MSHEDFNQELNALREKLPTLADEESASHAHCPAIYTLEIGKRAHNYALEGLTLRQIAKKPGMPEIGVLIRWSQENSEFAKMLRTARAARAMLHEEEVFRIADEIEDAKDAVKAKVQIDAHKWGAEVADPQTYGKKVAHSGEVNQVVKFVKVVTGFGPLPDALKFPELNPDGTIKKPEPKDVVSEVTDAGPKQETETQQPPSPDVAGEEVSHGEGPSDPANGGTAPEVESPGHEGSAQETRSPDTALSSSGY